MKAGSSARIRPGSRRELGWVNAGIARISGLAVGGRAPNVVTTVARHRRLFRRWLFFAGALMPGGVLPREESELVILRVAHNSGSDYEWAQHERIARMAGLSEEEIARVRIGAEAPGWSARRAAILAAVDELHGDNRIGDEVWTRLTEHMDEIELIELCMLTGHYTMLAMTLNSLGVEVDPIPEGRSVLQWASKR